MSFHSDLDTPSMPPQLIYLISFCLGYMYLPLAGANIITIFRAILRRDYTNRSIPNSTARVSLQTARRV